MRIGRLGLATGAGVAVPLECGRLLVITTSITQNVKATFQNEFLQKFRLTKDQFEQLVAGRYILHYDLKTGKVFENDTEKACRG